MTEKSFTALLLIEQSLCAPERQSLPIIYLVTCYYIYMSSVVSIRFQTNLAAGDSKYVNFRRVALWYISNINCD